MTKDVLIRMKGLQYDTQSTDVEDDDRRVETLTRGLYYKKNGHHYIIYEESPDGTSPVKTTIKFNNEMFEVTRRGVYSVHLLFEAGKKGYTDYKTPFGSFVIGTDTGAITLIETDNVIRAGISYNLEMNYEHLAECTIDMVVESVLPG